jgi:hypothetical protein
MSINSPFLPSDHSSELLVQFLADLLRATLDHHDHAAFQRALQSYCDTLRPWLEPSDSPPNPRAIFSLLAGCTFDETGDNVAVVLSQKPKHSFAPGCAAIKSVMLPDSTPRMPGRTDCKESGVEA